MFPPQSIFLLHHFLMKGKFYKESITRLVRDDPVLSLPFYIEEFLGVDYPTIPDKQIFGQKAVVPRIQIGLKQKFSRKYVQNFLFSKKKLLLRTFLRKLSCTRFFSDTGIFTINEILRIFVLLANFLEFAKDMLSHQPYIHIVNTHNQQILFCVAKYCSLNSRLGKKWINDVSGIQNLNFLGYKKQGDAYSSGLQHTNFTFLHWVRIGYSVLQMYEYRSLCSRDISKIFLGHNLHCRANRGSMSIRPVPVCPRTKVLGRRIPWTMFLF